MDQSDQLDELLTCRLNFGTKTVEPYAIVIFGASGDLTARKLIPALYHLFAEKQLPTPCKIIGFARREKSDEAWRAELKEALAQFSRTKRVDQAVWDAFAVNLHYCQGEFSEASAYQKLGDMLSGFGNEQLRNNLVFYLSTSPASLRKSSNIFRKPSCCAATSRTRVGSEWSSKSHSATIWRPRRS